MGEVSAIKCSNIREMPALDQAIADTDVQAHVDTCGGCAPSCRPFANIFGIYNAIEIFHKVCGRIRGSATIPSLAGHST
jgi:hypothetical protein